MSKTKVTEAEVPEEEILLCSGDVLVCLVSDGEVGRTVTVAGRTRRRRMRKVGLWIASPRIAGSFGESDREIGTWVDGTLET
jgi:hypothetical protein